jgi:hypothetical protein
MQERVQARAKLRVHHERAVSYDSARGIWHYEPVGEDEEIWNLVPDAGRIQMHAFLYDSSVRTNGFNYMAVSNDGTAPAASDIALAGELTTNGMQRVQAVVTLPVGTGNATTIANTFTYTGGSPQQVQKTALFDTVIGGVMTHEVLFTQRTLVTNDTLGLIFTITFG